MTDSSSSRDAAAIAAVADLPARSELALLQNRRLKRLAIALAATLLALLVLRLWWGWEANRRAEAALARYRAEGGLVFAEDFNAEFDAVPDDQNAALLYEEAMQKTVMTATSGMQLYELFGDLVVRAEHPDDVADLIRLNATPLALCRAARSRPSVAWNDPLGLSAVNAPFVSSLFRQRELCELLSLAAGRQFGADDHAGFIESLHDLLKLGRSSQAGPLVIWQVMGVASTVQVPAAVEAYGAGLKVSGAETPGAGCAKPASYGQAHALIEELWDEEGQAATWRRAILGERACAIVRMQAYMDRPTTRWSWEDPRTWLARFGWWAGAPAHSIDSVRWTDATTVVSTCTGLPNWPAAAAAMPSDAHKLRSFVDVWARPVSVTWVPNLDYLSLAYLDSAGRRLAATALAIRLYEIDHGHRPAALADLLPEYLPGAPVDPFAPNGEWLHYLPNDEHPRLYSIGKNGVDDGGAAWGTEYVLRWLPREVPDCVLFLDGPVTWEEWEAEGARRLPETQHDDEHVDDRQGQGDQGDESPAEPGERQPQPEHQSPPA